MKVAIVGGGIAGLSCAHLLAARHEVTVFEKAPALGGHAHSARISTSEGEVAVDTGFIVYNDANYPLFSALLEELGVASQPSEMSFSVARLDRSFAYRPTQVFASLATRANVADPSFYGLLRDIVVFNRFARAALDEERTETLGELLERGPFSARLARDFVVPLGSAIWSAVPAHLLDMPIVTYATFMANHGLLSVRERPSWRTITGGSGRYVDALRARTKATFAPATPVSAIVRHDDKVELALSGAGTASFDALVLATHSDEALALLSDPSREEQAVLGAITFQDNDVTLHSDESLLARRRSLRASWNAHLLAPESSRATLTYDMNRLQSLPTRDVVLVSLNMDEHIDEALVHERTVYAHPLLDAKAIAAQARKTELQGVRATYYCGAYWGFGFHEDGVRSAYDVADALERVACPT